MPRAWYTVAATWGGMTARSFGAAPIASDEPTVWPPLTPPPASTTVQHCGQWSRPPAGLMRGSAAELAGGHYERGVEQTTVAQIFEQGTVSVVEHRAQSDRGNN